MPNKGSKITPSNKWVLKMNKLDPRYLVFSDQYESRLEVRQFTDCGNTLSTQQYHKSTIFCNSISSNIFVVHQVGLTDTKNVQAKLRFKRDSASVGFLTQYYCPNNGIYASKDFSRELDTKGKCIKHSVICGHHHNGVAENP